MKLLENGDQFLLKLLLKMMKKLTLKESDHIFHYKFDYMFDYMFKNFYYKVSARKLCSNSILIDTKISPDLRSLPHSVYT